MPAGRLPTHVTLRVETADPYVQGDRVSPQYKPATVTGGTIILVPPFVRAGESIIVDTRDSTFVKRVG